MMDKISPLTMAGAVPNDETFHVHRVECPGCHSPLLFPALNNRRVFPTETVPMLRCNGCGHLYNGEVSGCDCGSRDFTPMLALLVEVKP